MRSVPRRARAYLPVLVSVALLGGCRAEPPALSVETRDAPRSPAATGTPVDAPRAVSFDPPRGATGVDPGRTTIAVTFDRQMDPEGWAWVIESETTAPEIGDSSWDPARRTRTVAVRLQPGRRYVVWVNSEQYPYFKDTRGVPATPVRWEFTTGGSSHPVISPRAGTASGPPRVTRLSPENGAADVDPSLAELRVEFDRPMAEGWSWVREEGGDFPALVGRAGQSADRREAFLPVALEPGRSYVVWLNSDAHRDFQDPAGTPLPPLRWTFSTRPTG